MASLDAFVQRVMSAEAGREGDVGSWIKTNIETLKRHNVTQIDSALQAFDVRRSTHAVLALLYAKSTIVSAADEIFIVQLCDFFRGCIGEQVRPLARYFAHVAHFFTDYLCKRHEALRGIQPLIYALERLQMHSAQLTSIHADLCQLALASGCFKPVLRYLAIDYTEVNNEDAQRKFDRALLYFELCLTVPASVMSFIMVDAYKKMLLTSLIVSGKGDASLDVMISRYVRRQAHLMSQSYTELVQAYHTESIQKLQLVIEKDRDVFSADRNLGLVKYVKLALVKQNVKKLARAYVTLSLNDVSKHIGLTDPAEAIHVLATMVEQGEIDAKIDERQQVVTFSSDSLQRFEASEQALSKIDAEARYLIDVLKQIRNVDESLETNPQWLKKIASGQD